jgi:hypothetical protein
VRNVEDGRLNTVPLTDDTLPAGTEDAMVTVWENGELRVDEAFATIRTRADRVHV